MVCQSYTQAAQPHIETDKVFDPCKYNCITHKIQMEIFTVQLLFWNWCKRKLKPSLFFIIRFQGLIQWPVSNMDIHSSLQSLTEWDNSPTISTWY